MKLLERTARYFPTGSRPQSLVSQWVTTVMIVVHIGLALAILVGGKDRFSLPTYQPIIDLSDGHTWLWGVHIGFSALLMILPYRVLNIAGLWLGMLWMVMWTVLFSVSILQYPTASATAAVAYAGFAMINAALLTARVIEKQPSRP